MADVSSRQLDFGIAVTGFVQEDSHPLIEDGKLLSVLPLLECLIVMKQVGESAIDYEGLNHILLLHAEFDPLEVVAIQVDIEDDFEQVVDPADVFVGEKEEPVGCFVVSGCLGEPEAEASFRDFVSDSLLGVANGGVDGAAKVGFAGDEVAAFGVGLEEMDEVFPIERIFDPKVNFHVVMIAF